MPITVVVKAGIFIGRMSLAWSDALIKRLKVNINRTKKFMSIRCYHANHTRRLLRYDAVIGKTNVTSFITFVNVPGHCKCYSDQSHVITSYHGNTHSLLAN